MIPYLLLGIGEYGKDYIYYENENQDVYPVTFAFQIKFYHGFEPDLFTQEGIKRIISFHGFTGQMNLVRVYSPYPPHRFQMSWFNLKGKDGLVELASQGEPRDSDLSIVLL